MAIENPASTPDTDDLRSALESAWDETSEAAADPPQAAVAEPASPETAEAKAERARDELGRFTKAEQEAADAARAVEKAATDPSQQQPVEQQAEKPAAPSGPPSSWSIAAKAAFDKADPAIKEAVAKREFEINQGFAKLAEYKGLDDYNEMARNSGTTLQEALGRYVNAEQVLAQNFDGGVVNLCRMYGVHPVQLAQSLIHQFGGQAMRGQEGGHQQPQQPDPMGPVFQKISALEAEINRQNWERQQQEQMAVSSQIDSFSRDPANRFFENVKQDMGMLLQTGQAGDLQDAYDKACWMNSEIRSLRIKEQQDAEARKQAEAVNKARTASKSLRTGAPLPGVSPRNDASSSIRGAIEDAYSSLGVSI